jgi:hypothetical protein
MFHDLKNLLGDALKRHQIERPVTASRIVEAANEALPSILPAGRSTDARAVAYQQGIITVRTANAAAGQLIRSKSMQLFDTIKRFVPTADIRDVRVIIG